MATFTVTVNAAAAQLTEISQAVQGVGSGTSFAGES
jgi:hypothetical protein